jgi:MazG family protein
VTTHRQRPDESGSQSSARAGSGFRALVEIMRTLRSPEGCPWDREQTLQSLTPFVLEEAYEVIDAIERDDYDALRGELGDFLFEAVFLAQICAEEGRFTIDDAIRAVSEKLVRRHPHVFRPATDNAGPGADEAAGLDANDVRVQWETVKDRERQGSGEERRILAGIPRTLPSLLRAFEIGSRVAAVGFDWTAASDVLAKIEEEVAELRIAVEREGSARAEEEMGDLLFALVSLSRKLGIEPEGALRKANEKFTRRFGGVEARLHARGTSVHDASLDEMEREWAAVKEQGH